MDHQRHWRQGCAHLSSGRYWEAHESFEDIWRDLERGQRRDAVQALIQFAAACYKVVQHRRDDRPAENMQRGMRLLLESASGHLEGASSWGWEAALAEHLDALEDVHCAWSSGELLGQDLQARVDDLAIDLAAEVVEGH